MHFKRLELFGFKSFAERTVFHFESGVTAIVGPNGCGKTNCVDAIRWVLGEQNARDLRGHKMEDIIFNGTEGVPPLGFAEVSLTLDNEDRSLPIDYAEVVITRRVYRSGESEYLINKLSVRLRDITELLMGTGIGVESYSIIGQGQVNQILSQRPEDRRAVFEEASGITRYKSQKREALRKLDHTQQNVMRVNDIVVEVERQLRSIERQVAKAKRYRARFEALKTLELTLAAVDHQQQQRAVAELQMQQQSLETRARDVTATWEQLKQQEDELTHDREILMQELTQQQTARAQCQGTLDSHRKEVELKIQWRAELQAQQVQLAGECEHLRGRLEQIHIQIDEAQQLCENVRIEESEHVGRVDAVAADITAMEARLAQVHDALQATKQIVLDQNTKLSQLRSERAEYAATIHAGDARIQRLQTIHASCDAQMSAVEVTQGQHRVTTDTLEADVARQHTALATARTQQAAADADVKQADDRCASLHHTRAKQAAACQFLEQLWQRHEGLSAGVRALLDAQHPDVVGMVADLMDVDAGWESSIEAALGSFAQTIVVHRTQDAWRLMGWLQSQGAGRAQFLPLDQLPGEQAAAPQPAIAVLGSAMQFVRVCDHRIEAMLQQRLANVWCIESLREVTAWPRGDVRLIDRSGNMWQRGVLIGGSRNDQTSVVGRRARLDESTHQLAVLESDVVASEAVAQEKRERAQQLHADVEQRTVTVHELGQQQAAHLVLVQQADAAYQRISDERTVIASELQSAEADCQEARQHQHMTEQAIGACESALQSGEHTLQTHQSTIMTLTQQREQHVVERAQLCAHRDTVSTRRSTLEETVQGLTERAVEMDESLVVRISRIAEAQTKAEQFVHEVAGHQLAMTELESTHMTLQATVMTLSGQVTTLKDQIDAIDPDVMQAQRSLESLREQQRTTDVAYTEAVFTQRALAERVHTHYQCAVPTEVDPTVRTEDLQAMRADAEQRRNRLESMGSVSLDSITDEEELRQRYTFLNAQRDDLSEAEVALREAIRRINRETRKKFLETFEQIRHEFGYFFTLLFDGGRAELRLMDEQEVLDCGIEINAQPPGKKLQSLSLLSGGEQAMTAVALLFALFKVRPSPFCILDEIDAPLDESNVDRFTNALGEFTRLSQFIIITHNKKTITKSDLMYGITMEQAGISKIVSVKFAEEEDQRAAPATSTMALA